MKYLDGKFSVALGGASFAEGWERTFGKQSAEPEEKPVHICGKSRDDVCEHCWEQWADAEPIPPDVECSGGSCRRVRRSE